jgi:hypothetical protein
LSLTPSNLSRGFNFVESLQATLHLQNAGGQGNFSSSNLAGLVWGWTVYKSAWSANSSLRLHNNHMHRAGPAMNATHFANADRCASLYFELDVHN